MERRPPSPIDTAGPDQGLEFLEPIVKRRSPSFHSRLRGRSGSAEASPGVGRRPTVQTIDSLASTGSQAEFFRPDQTILLLDWDDTLCPTDWLRANQLYLEPGPEYERYQGPLRELQELVGALLTMSLKLGKVVIVTNAMDPWVETTCRIFMPSLLPLVATIPVIYARSLFDCVGLEEVQPKPKGRGTAVLKMFTRNFTAFSKVLGSVNGRLAAQHHDEPGTKWKECAFKQEIADFYSRYNHQSWKNVISIGDSVFERDAVHKVVLERPNSKKKCRTKSVKLLSKPSIGALITQLRMIHDTLALMVNYDGNLDIKVDTGDLRPDVSLTEKILSMCQEGADSSA